MSRKQTNHDDDTLKLHIHALENLKYKESKIWVKRHLHNHANPSKHISEVRTFRFKDISW